MGISLGIKPGTLLLSATLLVTSLVIGGLIITNNQKAGVSLPQLNQPSPPPKSSTSQPSRDQGLLENVRPVSSNDHILGNLGAEIKIVEYSDLECPFCQAFHPILKRVFEEYSQNQQVAWIFRHFPLEGSHPRARKAAEATECAASLGGNEKFWAYVNRLFETAPASLDPKKLVDHAHALDLNREDFQKCLASGEFSARVQTDLDNAYVSGGSRTPYSILVAKNGQKVPINGQVEYEQLKVVVEDLLRASR